MRFALLIASVLLAGCAGSNRPPRYQPSNLTEISILTPGLDIQKLAGETAVDSINIAPTIRKIQEISASKFEGKEIHCKQQNALMNDSVQAIFEDAIASARSSNKPDTISLSPGILGILSKSQTRYTGYFYYSGFYRTGGNMAWGVTKAILVGVVTLGLYIPVPIQNSSTLYFILFDNLNHKIAYDVSDHTQDSPLDRENLDGQITRVISKLKT